MGESLTTALQNDRLLLRPYEAEDATALAPLFSDAESLKRYLPGAWRLFSKEATAALLADWNQVPSYQVLTLFRRVEGERREILGLVNVDQLDFAQRNAELGIALLPVARRQGYACEALELVLDFLFRQWNLHRVYAHIFETNTPSRRLFSSLGFREEGRMREQLFRDNRYEDLCVYGLLKEESRWK